MKAKFFVLLVALTMFFTSYAFAQTCNNHTVTATITDSDGQTWNNGTFTVSIYNPSGGQLPVCRTTGVPITTTFSGTLDGTGTLSVSLPDTSKVDPPIQWIFSILPNASVSPSVMRQIPVTGDVNLSSSFSSQVTAVRIVGSAGQYAYADGEIIIPVQNGANYFNVSTTNLRIFNNGAWTSIGSSSVPNPLTKTFYDTGGSVFNVYAYGAIGNGVANDCAALTSAASAINTANAGRMRLPKGKFNVGSSCHITFTTTAIIEGDAACAANTPCISTIISSDPTGDLFTFTNNGLLRDVGINNTATVTAGHAVNVTESVASNAVSLENVSISGFFTSISEEGTNWHITGSTMTNAKQSNVDISNPLNTDAGDWVLGFNTFGCSGCTANVRLFGTGGGKLLGNKIIATGAADDFQLDCTGLTCTGELIIVGNDIYTASGTGIPVHILNGNNYNQITLANNMINAATGTTAVSVTKANSMYIGGGTIDSSSLAAHIVSIDSTSSNVTIMPFVHNQANTTPNAVSCTTNCNDYGSLSLGFLNAPQGLISFSNLSSAGIDTGLSRLAAGFLGVGNGTKGDVSGTITASVHRVVNSVNFFDGVSTYDSGISRISPKVFAFGSTTPGDFSGTVKTTNYLDANGHNLYANLSATTGSLGGSALVAGQCVTTTVTISGASVANNGIVVTPGLDPGNGFFWSGYISGTNTITVKLCAAVAGTPTATTYVVKMMQ